LTVSKVWLNTTVAQTARLVRATQQLGLRDSVLLDRMVAGGPGFIHALPSYEGNVVRWSVVLLLKGGVFSCLVSGP